MARRLRTERPDLKNHDRVSHKKYRVLQQNKTPHEMNIVPEHILDELFLTDMNKPLSNFIKGE